MFIVVDASVWVARLLPGDVFYQSVRTWMLTHVNQRTEFLSPALLLVEIGAAIRRRTGESFLALQAIERLQQLPELRSVEMDGKLIQEAASLAANLGLRGADSVYVAVAARLNLPLFTLDMDQKERASESITVLEL